MMPTAPTCRRHAKRDRRHLAERTGRAMARFKERFPDEPARSTGGRGRGRGQQARARRAEIGGGGALAFNGLRRR
jgi:hypothetical protein